MGTPQINLIHGVLKNGVFENEYFKLDLPEYKRISEKKVILGIRAENIMITNQGDFGIQVDYTEFLGSKTIIHGLLGQTEISVITKEDIQNQEKITVVLNKKKIILFDEETTKAIGSDKDEGTED